MCESLDRAQGSRELGRGEPLTEVERGSFKELIAKEVAEQVGRCELLARAGVGSVIPIFHTDTVVFPKYAYFYELTGEASEEKSIVLVKERVEAYGVRVCPSVEGGEEVLFVLCALIDDKEKGLSTPEDCKNFVGFGGAEEDDVLRRNAREMVRGTDMESLGWKFGEGGQVLKIN